MKVKCSVCGKTKNNVIEYADPYDSQHSVLIDVPILPDLVCIDCIKKKHGIDIDLSIPKDLDGWNYYKILNYVENTFEEDEELEYLNKAWKLSKEERLNAEKKFCSFANTNGGYIIFGIKENRNKTPLQTLESLEIKGIDDVPNTDIRIANIIKNTNPHIKLRIKKINIPDNEKLILVVEIVKSVERPIQSSEGIFYIRIQSESKPMNRETIKNLFWDSDQKSYQRYTLLFELEDIKIQCTRIAYCEKKEWKTFPILFDIDPRPLKNSLILNSKILKSTELREDIGVLLLGIGEINGTVKQLNAKISGGLLNIAASFKDEKTAKSIVQGVYKEYNKGIIKWAKDNIELIDKIAKAL